MPQSNWGGKRPNAGRNRQRVTLEPEAAKSLWLLVKHQRALLDKPELTQEDIVTQLIEEKWREIEEGYQEAAKIVEEGAIIL